MNQGDFHDPYMYDHDLFASGPGGSGKPPVWQAVAAGVGTTALIATTMYFLGGREAPSLPSLDSWKKAVSREVGLEGALFVRGGHAHAPAVPHAGDLILFKDEYEAFQFSQSLRSEGIDASDPFKYEHQTNWMTKKVFWAVQSKKI